MTFTNLPGVEPCFFKKGDILIKNGDRVEFIYYLRQGTVYREMMTDKGSESILSCKEGGGLTDSLVGVLLLYDQSGSLISYNNFVAGTDCYCLRIPADAFKRYVRAHPALLEQLVGTAVHECGYMMNLYLGKSGLSAPAAICRWILERVQEDDTGDAFFEAYNHNDIAKFLNLHKVTVSRIFSALQRAQIIEKNGKGYLVKDLDRMQAFANNECQLKYS